MRDKILEILKLTRGNALSIEEIFSKVSTDTSSINEFKNILKELQEEKLVYCVNSNKSLYTLNPFKEGTFHIRRNGKCYVTSNGETYDIDGDKTYGCLEGDKVLVRITDFNK